MPLHEALRPDAPLQPAEQAELTISRREPASRSGSPAETGSADAIDSGRLDEAATPLPAAGTGSPHGAESAATVSCDDKTSAAPRHVSSHEQHMRRCEQPVSMQPGCMVVDMNGLMHAGSRQRRSDPVFGPRHQLLLHCCGEQTTVAIHAVFQPTYFVCDVVPYVRDGDRIRVQLGPFCGLSRG